MAAIWKPASGILLFQMSAFIRVTSSQLVNIALNKPTSVSSMTDKHRSDLAVDGDTTDVMCYRSAISDGNDTWWLVDLTEVVTVQQVTLYLSEQYSYRINGSEIHVLKVPDIPERDLEPCTTVFRTENETDVPDVINVVCSTEGRYVAIVKRGNQDNSHDSALDLCEVQVFVCLNGSYGSNCSGRCGQCDMGGCDSVSGACQEGCKRGYTGDLCEEACERAKYGENCSLTCGHCGDGCDHVTGSCNGGCMDGCTGTMCNKTLISEKDDGGMSPVVAGVIGALIMLAAVILICVICFCVAKVRKLHTSSVSGDPTVGISSVRYRRSKDDVQPEAQNTVSRGDTDEINNHYEEFESPRYVSTSVSPSGTLIGPTIIITPDASESTPTETDHSKPDPSEPDLREQRIHDFADDSQAVPGQYDVPPSHEYMAMGVGIGRVMGEGMEGGDQPEYEPVERPVDSDTLPDHHEQGQSLGDDLYISMREVQQYQDEDTSM